MGYFVGFEVAGAIVVKEFVGLIVGLVVGRDVAGAPVFGAEVAGASVPGAFVGFIVGLEVGRDVTGLAVVGLLVGLSDTVGGLVLDGRIFTSAQFQNSSVTDEI